MCNYKAEVLKNQIETQPKHLLRQNNSLPATSEYNLLSDDRGGKNMNANNMQQLSETEKFLGILDPDQMNFTFLTFDDAQQGRPLTKELHGSLAEHQDELIRSNKEGAGIFVTVNKTDLKGREKKNIVGIRSIWMDDDGDGKDLPFPSHMTVETSPGKYHRYVLTISDAVDEFDAVQARMDEYGSDPAAKGINRVLRLPGFYHMKDPDNPHLVKITQESGQPPFPWVLIKDFYPPVEGTTANATDVWTTEPVSEYTPFSDDNELIKKARESKASAQATWDDGVTFKQLWDRDAEALGKAYTHETNPYDASRADAALAIRLMFWTGKNCDHVDRLMWLSGLIRGKWKKHKTYLRRTIQKCYLRSGDTVYTAAGTSVQRATPGEVINKLSDMLVKLTTADDWFPVVHSANLNPTGLNEVFNFLGSDPRMMSSKAIIKREYNNRAADADAAGKMCSLVRMAEDEEKVLIRFIPQDLNNGVLETEKAMIDIPGQWSYFNYGGMLGYTADDIPSWKATGIDDTEPPKVQVIKRYNRNSLFLRIEQSVKYYQEKKDGPVSIPVPQEIINKLIDHPSPLAPKVSGLISHPIITLDGRVIFSEGIDEQTGLLFEFGGTTFREPGPVDKKLAWDWVNWIGGQLFSEFIFLQPTEGTVAALAFLMTGVFRKVIDKAPGIMVKANMQGSGKTTLAQFIHVILTGRDMPVSGLGSTSEEMKKEMLATLIQSPAMVCYDNILDGSEIRDQVLAKVLTSPHYKGRLLGETREITVPTNSLLVLTGNNITLSADLVRRFMTIELTADIAQPEGRTFRTPDVVQHCLNHRSDVLLGCLIITKAYIDARSPELSKPGSGFREWDKMVRFPLLWATGVDVLNAIKSNKEQSTEHIAMNGLMLCLAQLYPKQQPFSSSDLLTRLSTENKWLQNSELLDQTRECITNMSVKGLKDTRSLSWVLKKMEGRLINGKKLKYTANSAGNYGKFMVTG